MAADGGCSCGSGVVVADRVQYSTVAAACCCCIFAAAAAATLLERDGGVVVGGGACGDVFDVRRNAALDGGCGVLRVVVGVAAAAAVASAVFCVCCKIGKMVDESKCARLSNEKTVASEQKVFTHNLRQKSLSISWPASARDRAQRAQNVALRRPERHERQRRRRRRRRRRQTSGGKAAATAATTEKRLLRLPGGAKKDDVTFFSSRTRRVADSTRRCASSTRREIAHARIRRQQFLL